MKKKLWIISGLVAVLLVLLSLPMAAQAFDIPRWFERDGDGWFVNIPTDRGGDVTLPPEITRFRVYDNGGKYNKYRMNLAQYFKFTAPEGCRFKVTGTVATEGKYYTNLFGGLLSKKYDYLLLYSDNGVNPKEYYSRLDGEPAKVGPYYTTGNILTVRFKDDNAVVFDGFELIVEVAPPIVYEIGFSNTITHGTVTSDKSTAIFDETVTLTATPDDGYILEELKVVELSSESFWTSSKQVRTSEGNGWWGNGAAITFQMPENPVVVLAEFREIKSEESHVFKMNNEWGRTIYLNQDAMTFKLYNDNGSSGYATSQNKDRVHIVSPEGYQIRVSGSINADVDIYDGYPDDGNKVISYEGIKNYPRVVDFISTGNVITLDSYINLEQLSGVDLTFTVYFPRTLQMHLNNPEHSEAYFYLDPLKNHDHPKYYQMNLVTGTKTFLPGETVKIDAYCDKGYQINHVYVETENGEYIECTKPNPREHLYSFTMPYRNATLHVITEIPVIGIPDIWIPYQVQLNVYTGGTVTIADGDIYDMGETVTLTVTPDEGNKLREEEFRAETVSGNKPVEMIKTDENTWQFTMPEDDVKVFACFDPILETNITVYDNYGVTVLPSEHGYVTASNTYLRNEDPVTLTVNADPGFELFTLKVLLPEGEGSVDVTEVDDNIWRFTMPSSPVNVEAVFTIPLATVLNGNGTAQDPYLIQSGADWEYLSKTIARGAQTEGLYFRLTGDIGISSTLGTAQMPFSGVFDGKDYTMYIMQHGTGSEGFAPFRNIKGATIRKLKITGTVTGSPFCSGLVGQAEGENLIHDCVFIGTVSGTDQAATFIAESIAGSSTTLRDCLDLSGSACPIGRGAGTVVAPKTYVVNPDQLTAAAGSWAGKGEVIYSLDWDYLLKIQLTDNSEWYQYDGIIYAPANGQVQINVRKITDEIPYGLIFQSEGQEVLRLMTDEEGIIAFNMPARNITAYWGCLVVFEIDDATELQSGMLMYGEMPEYNGATPARPDDEKHYTFMGWTPQIETVTGNTVYTAEFAISNVLHLGATTMYIDEYELVLCPFTGVQYNYDVTNHDYHIWSENEDDLSLIVRIYDETGKLVSYNYDGNGVDLHNFDLYVHIPDEKTYMVEITSLYNSGNATIHVERAYKKNIYVLPYDKEMGTLLAPRYAYYGQRLFIHAIPNEGYGVSKLSFNNDYNQIIKMSDDGCLYMPNSTLNIQVEFAPTITIEFTSDSHLHFDTLDNGDMINSVEDYTAALPGREVKATFYCDEGYGYESVLVGARDGNIIPSQVTFDEPMNMYVVQFTMPNQYVMVQGLSQQEVTSPPATEFNLPEGLHEVGEEAFAGANLESVSVPDGCKVIGKGAFRDCSNLTTVVLPGDCAIMEDAFAYCPSVTLYSTPGSLAEAWCLIYANCEFVAISP